MSYLSKIDKKAIIYISVFIFMVMLGSFTYTKLSSIDVKTASGEKQDSNLTEMRTGETYDELKLKYDSVYKETKFLRGEVERLIKDNKNLRTEKEELEERVQEIKQEIKSLVYKIDNIEQKL